MHGVQYSLDVKTMQVIVYLILCLCKFDKFTELSIDDRVPAAVWVLGYWCCDTTWLQVYFLLPENAVVSR